MTIDEWLASDEAKVQLAYAIAQANGQANQPGVPPEDESGLPVLVIKEGTGADWADAILWHLQSYRSARRKLDERYGKGWDSHHSATANSTVTGSDTP